MRGIPTPIEFSARAGAHVINDYMRDFPLYTPDHYASYSLILKADGTLLEKPL